MYPVLRERSIVAETIKEISEKKIADEIDKKKEVKGQTWKCESGRKIIVCDPWDIFQYEFIVGKKASDFECLCECALCVSLK